MNDWKKVKLGEIIEYNPTERLSKGTLAKKIAMEKIEPFTRDIPEFELLEYKGGTKFRNGDTLMARITPSLENGKTAKVSLLDKYEVGFGSTEFIVARARKGISDENFIYYLMLSPSVRDVAIKSMVGTSGRQRVQLDVVKNYEVLCPPLSEQIQIGKILSVIDDKIENNKKINHHLEQMAMAIFKSWFIDFEPFGGRMPSDWRIANLTDIAEYLNGLAMQKYRPLDDEEGLPVLKIKELRQGTFDSSSDLCSAKINSQYIVKDGDVIFSWSGSLLVDFWTGGTGGLNQHLFKVSSQNYDKWFYYSWTKYHLEEFAAIAADKATTMGHITRSSLEKAEVLIPNNQDYKFLALLLAPIYDQIIYNRVENRRLMEVRNTLLPKLLSGEICVNQATK
ncbi:restriction endonuclease subunit S [Streptococcus suis]|nr:restriction endonuclease subunit S [Streptococcus suis]NQO92892.1 restriction endonuclease subunit S [Streptococcus suis]HEM5473718.1 restriction endonuclease subunit S [Streptococcus suis]